MLITVSLFDNFSFRFYYNRNNAQVLRYFCYGRRALFTMEVIEGKTRLHDFGKDTANKKVRSLVSGRFKKQQVSAHRQWFCSIIQLKQINVLSALFLQLGTRPNRARGRGRYFNQVSGRITKQPTWTRRVQIIDSCPSCNAMTSFRILVFIF